MSGPAIDLTRTPELTPASSENGAQLGGLSLDKDAHVVSVDGRLVSLTRREFTLLAYFVEHPGRLLTRRQIVHEVWGEHYGGSARTVDIHVSRLRRKLGAALPLDTLRQFGYRFGSLSLAAP